MTQRTFLDKKMSISASEIGQYYFCSMAWYLNRCGFKPKLSSLQRGLEKHDNISELLNKIEKQEKQFRLLRWFAILIFFFALVILFIEVILSIF